MDSIEVSIPVSDSPPSIAPKGVPTKHSLENPCLFLDKLPPELRIIIYRLVLVTDEPISDSPSVRRKEPMCRRHHPNLLRTCRLIYSEAQPVLYSENTFQLRINEALPGDVKFIGRLDFVKHAKRYRRGFHCLRRFKITVRVFNLKERTEFRDTKSTVRSAATALAEIPYLDYLHITLDKSRTLESIDYRIFEDFTMLRKVRTVEFEGVSPVYASYLQTKMTGRTPVDHLPKMYDALVHYTGSFEWTQKALKEAADAMEVNDVELFKRVREGIVSSVDEYIENARSHLYDHDAQD